MADGQLASRSPEVSLKNYALVTAAYWGFTLTDGALRMLVLLHFHQHGFTPINLAFLFLLYEFFGVVTNLLGGWIASRVGLRATLFAGLGLQIAALLMLSYVQPSWALRYSVIYVMFSQALSGIAKDLTKMSSKSAVKLLVPEESSRGQSSLFRWVAVLTGSKNALKGIGFFLGGLLLEWMGFRTALWAMAIALSVVLGWLLVQLKVEMGKSKVKVKISQLFSKSREINLLSFARFFLFGSRDVWFVVGLPVFLSNQLNWSFSGVGGFLAVWVIGYGIVQAAAPRILRSGDDSGGVLRSAQIWSVALAFVSALLAVAIQFDIYPMLSILVGLVLFGVVFAVNSSLHSYLILAFTDSDRVALNVGFYYMANACGRLVGTLLSGISYMAGGISLCLWTSTAMVSVAAVLTMVLSTTSTIPANVAPRSSG